VWPSQQTAGKDATDRVELAPVFSNRSASFLKLKKVRETRDTTRERFHHLYTFLVNAFWSTQT
jgi:hypothetical protein